MKVVSFVLENTPQSLNVLAFKLQHEELYLEFRVIDEVEVEVVYLIKGPNRLSIGSFGLKTSTSFSEGVMKQVAQIIKESKQAIRKIFVSERTVFTALSELTEEFLDSIQWDMDVALYLVCEKETSLGPIVLNNLAARAGGDFFKISALIDFNNLELGVPCTENNEFRQELAKIFNQTVVVNILGHYELCRKLFILREKFIGVRLKVKVGVTSTREDIVDKRDPLIMGLSYLQYIVCGNARSSIVKKEKRNTKLCHFRLAMSRTDLYDLVLKFGKPDVMLEVMDRKVVYAEYLGKKVFYLIEYGFYDRIFVENRVLFAELSTKAYKALIENLMGEICQQHAQRTMYHTVAVHDYPLEAEVLHKHALQWFKLRGFQGSRLTMGHIATYLFKNNMMHAY